MKIKIGLIQRPFGIKGEVKIRPETDDIKSYYAVGDVLQLELKNETHEYTIETVRMHQKSLLIKFKELKDRTAVEPLHGATIFVMREKLEDLEDDEFYFIDLEGCTVFEDDKELGVVSEVLDMPAHPVLRVKTKEDDILVPFVKAFVKDVNIDEKKIVIKHMEGLY